MRQRRLGIPSVKFVKYYYPDHCNNDFAREILTYLDRLASKRRRAYEIMSNRLRERGVNQSPRTIRAWANGEGIPQNSDLILEILRSVMEEHEE